ncbi:MAG TPA: M10 family metallopeptidase C-terminal domain-containing protein, partial [Xenococcaceae cyanobacterium]
VFGGDGKDLIDGGADNDLLIGGKGDDTVLGQEGEDVILGNSGNDVIDGGLGNDTITGGPGSDILTGGAGADVFVFKPGTDFKKGFVDVITDFDVNEDRIDLSAFNLHIDEDSQFAFDDFSNGMTQGLESAFYQIGADTVILSRPELGYNLGKLGDGTVSGVVLENVNIDDLGGANFIFPDAD